MDQTAYVQYLKTALRRERARNDINQQAISILSVACVTLVCLLVLLSN